MKNSRLVYGDSTILNVLDNLWRWKQVVFSSSSFLKDAFFPSLSLCLDGKIRTQSYLLRCENNFATCNTIEAISFLTGGFNF